MEESLEACSYERSLEDEVRGAKMLSKLFGGMIKYRLYNVKLSLSICICIDHYLFIYLSVIGALGISRISLSGCLITRPVNI